MCNDVLGNAIHSLKYSVAVGKRTVTYDRSRRHWGLPKHKLIADVSTRWGSTFEMVSRIIEQQAICAVLADDRKCWSKMPSKDEFTTLEDMVKVLEPLSYILTYALSGEQHVTVSAQGRRKQFHSGQAIPKKEEHEINGITHHNT